MSLLPQLSAELEALVGRALPSVVGVEHRRGQGSGIVLSSDGFVLTNAHVVAHAPELQVRIAARDRVQAERVGADAQTDLAVLRVGARDLPGLALTARRLRVGQLVIAIGNPFRFERSVSLGVVSAVDRSLQGAGGTPLEGLVQTDAAINPGNSGGPLLDAEGAVVGINTAAVPFAQGISFAVPARTASWVTAALIRRGEVRRPRLGIVASAAELSAGPATDAGQPRALQIHEVIADSAAHAAGLRAGDLLLSADHQEIASVDDLQRVMTLEESPDVHLTVLRGGARRDLVVRPRVEAAAAAH
ncbi:MAG TPA: trypsin-like peptidase domain-containing protein [Vicinamibacteria bacterium]|jgi:S1-C subfamily serine protease